MNLKYLKQFLQLSEFPSMSQYALKVGVTHAQVSRMVIELEKEFGFQLLVRDKTQGILKLTKKGETLVKRIPFIFREIDNMQALLKSDQDLERGLFDLHTTGYLVDYWIAPNLAKFKKDNPLITLNLFGREETLAPEEKKTMLTVSARTKEDDDYEQIPLRDFHIGLWASEDYIKRNGKPEHVADLARHVLICFERKWPERSYPTMNWYMNNTDFMLTPSNVIIIRSSVGIMKAAQAGLGIFSLAEENIKTMGMKFERILPHLEGPVVPMCFSYPTAWKDHVSIHKIREFLFNTFKKEL
ncbi:MAG: LysR family transcriptional regulator [Alphaproteobacteria bacterium]|nr:LysR family transcriptional regulator [Alphaproteobacteria bacterium]